MKAICNNCKFEVSGADNRELDNNFRGHAMTFGHMGFYIVDYDQPTKRLKFEWLAASHVSSEYEHNVGKLLAEKRAKLEELMKDPENNKSAIAALSTELETLQSLFENYNLGMNVFRRAQGGRAGLREQSSNKNLVAGAKADL